MLLRTYMTVLHIHKVSGSYVNGMQLAFTTYRGVLVVYELSTEFISLSQRMCCIATAYVLHSHDVYVA